jgi:hypothetical protein
MFIANCGDTIRLSQELTMVKFCSACWRKERHRKITPPSILYGVVLVGTFGIAWFFRPKQCLCCGKTRLI